MDNTEQNPASATSATSANASSITADPLTCQWAQCRERCTSPETLYDHVCERHVGRKSTNNLNLQCQWGNCRTTTVKRDHITSHIRVHVPLKPHKCEFCGKSFKRPQDLKKHVKTHADDSVLLRSPQPDAPVQKPSMLNTYHPQVPRSSGYDQYTTGHSQQGSYGYPTASHIQSHFSAPTAMPSYGPVYYNAPQASHYASGPSMESRKRGFEELNDFFAHAKRRQIDATQYHDLGARFGGVMNLALPTPGFQAGYDAGFQAATGSMIQDSIGTATAYQPAHVAPALQKQYTLPFEELKTKSDLLTIDNFLEQLQSTVYEHSDQAVAAGYQSMSQMQHVGLLPSYRVSHSPPHLSPHSTVSSSGTPGGYGPSTATSASFDDSTPALTPSSHAATSQSPASTHHHISPVSRPVANNAALYPTLPSFSSLTDAQSHAGANFTASSGTPMSVLGSDYDDFEARRRYSGGYLQRARRISPPQPGLGNVAESGDAASPSSRRSSIDLSKGLRNVGLSSPKQVGVKLPGVASITRRDTLDSASSAASESSADDRQEAWVQNMRVIEALQRYVRGRLERGEFERLDGEGAAGRGREGDPEQDGSSRGGYEGAAEHRAGMEGGQSRGGGGGGGAPLYPTLRTVQATS